MYTKTLAIFVDSQNVQHDVLRLPLCVQTLPQTNISTSPPEMSCQVLTDKLPVT